MLPFGSPRDIGGSVRAVVGLRALSWVLFSTVVVLKAPPAFAQMEPSSPSSVTIGDTAFVPMFEVRSRGEFRGKPVDMGGSDAQGGVAPALDAVGVVSSRVRVGLGAERGAFRGLISLQDARVWGGDGAEAWMRSTGAPAFTGVNEAYGEAHTGGTRPAFLRFGRQRLKWGQGLLLGDADFSPTGRSLDAVRSMVPWGDVEGEFLLSMLDAPRPSGPGFQDGSGPRRVGSFLMGSRWAWAIDPLLRWELAWLTRWADASSQSFSSFQTARAAGDTHTASLRVAGSRDAWEYGVEGFFQFGRASGLGLSGKPRRAWAAVASVSYRFDRLYLQPILNLGGAYASGDEQGDVYTQFDPVAPDVQGPFGVMDVFALSNLVEGHGAVGVTLADDCQLTLRYGYARMADRRGEWLNAYLMPIGRVPMGDANASPADGELGHELALAFQWALRPAFSLRAAYGLLLQGPGARAVLASSQRTPLGDNGQAAGGGSYSHGGYLQGLVRFP